MTAAMMAAGTAYAQPSSARRGNRPSIHDSVVGDGGSLEVTTGELRRALAEETAIVLDARPYEEYAVSHIPRARSVRGKPGTTPALYVADANQIMESVSDREQPLIVYCNGLYCGRSARFAEDLAKVGYRSVSRYQLGAPGWRALGGAMQVEKLALLRLLDEDRTSVLVDGRNLPNGKVRLRRAVPITFAEASKAKDDGRLPMTDHNTRIFVVADDGDEAREMAEAIVRNAFHNVSFFDGSVADLGELLRDA